MSAQGLIVAMPDRSNVGDFSVVAARLVEAACLARDGNSEAAEAQIARAMALLRAEPSAIPVSLRPLNRGTREVVHGSLPAWKKRRVTAFIDAHLTERIRVADLAELLDLSESHFSRVFSCTFGSPAHQYVTRRRIEVAQSLMLGSREPLCAIALRCGLCDQSHFTRVFRRTVGETPYAWRRARQAEIEDRPTCLSRSPTDSRHVAVLSNSAGSAC
jgi:AraC family transcriptional regulator